MASGTTRWRSNLAPHGSEILTGWPEIRGTKTLNASVTATDIRGKRKINAPVIQSTSYIKLNANQYIFFGAKNTAASMIANATALVGATIAGSLYVAAGAKPGLFIIKSTSVASRVEGY